MTSPTTESCTNAVALVDYPASFILVASMDPCPCGYHGHPTRQCTCMPNQVQKYMNKISGPLMDRIDIQVEIEPVEFDDIGYRALDRPSTFGLAF